jgi:hypothetical protein
MFRSPHPSPGHKLHVLLGHLPALLLQGQLPALLLRALLEKLLRRRLARQRPLVHAPPRAGLASCAHQLPRGHVPLRCHGRQRPRLLGCAFLRITPPAASRGRPTRNAAPAALGFPTPRSAASATDRRTAPWAACWGPVTLSSAQLSRRCMWGTETMGGAVVKLTPLPAPTGLQAQARSVRRPGHSQSRCCGRGPQLLQPFRLGGASATF